MRVILKNHNCKHLQSKAYQCYHCWPLFSLILQFEVFLRGLAGHLVYIYEVAMSGSSQDSTLWSILSGEFKVSATIIYTPMQREHYHHGTPKSINP